LKNAPETLYIGEHKIKNQLAVVIYTVLEVFINVKPGFQNNAT